MKKIDFAAVAAAVLCLFAATSCQKEGARLFKGNYSFKTSGYFTAVLDTTGIGGQPDTIDVVLPAESGQMDITETSTKDAVVVSMNVTGGDMLVFSAEATGDLLWLDTLSTKKNIVTSLKTLPSPLEATLDITGMGRKFDNIIIFEMDYSGWYYASDKKYDIIFSDIICRAKLNE